MAKEQVSSILRALEILECFMDNETEWTLKRLVAQLDLPTTTVHRQLSTLTDRGYLVQDPIRKSYRVGPRLLLLSSTVLSHSDLRSTARTAAFCNTPASAPPAWRLSSSSRRPAARGRRSNRSFP